MILSFTIAELAHKRRDVHHTLRSCYQSGFPDFGRFRPKPAARIIVGMHLESAPEPGQSASELLCEYRADLSNLGF